MSPKNFEAKVESALHENGWASYNHLAGPGIVEHPRDYQALLYGRENPTTGQQEQILFFADTDPSNSKFEQVILGPTDGIDSITRGFRIGLSSRIFSRFYKLTVEYPTSE